MNQFTKLPTENLFIPKHGGTLKAASEHFGIPLEQWIDLSTGINPQNYKIPAIPHEYYTRLPEPNSVLDSAIKNYYGQDQYLSAAGSQAIIQQIPNVFLTQFKNHKSIRVGICTPIYSEHLETWYKQSNIPVEIDLISPSEIELMNSRINQLDVLTIVNPCNPTGKKIPQQQLLNLRDYMAKNEGWLIVDEAFIDTEQQNSLLNTDDLNHLLILRSMGKFFGLPGMRAGFAFGDPKILEVLKRQLGPWSLSGPAQYICQQALSDTQWQQQQIQAIEQNQKRLVALLRECLDPLFNIHSDCPLFVTLDDKVPDQCRNLYQYACQHGLLLRFFPDYNLLRIGHPVTESSLQGTNTNPAWEKLQNILDGFYKTV